MKTTVEEYLKHRPPSFVDNLSKLVNDIKETPEDAKDILLKVAMELVATATDIYDAGYNACIEDVREVDIHFLKRKLPPHLQDKARTFVLRLKPWIK